MHHSNNLFPLPQRNIEDTGEHELQDAFFRLYQNNDFLLFTSLLSIARTELEHTINTETGVPLERAAAQRAIIDRMTNDFYDVIDDLIRPQDVK